MLASLMYGGQLAVSKPADRASYMGTGGTASGSPSITRGRAKSTKRLSQGRLVLSGGQYSVSIWWSKPTMSPRLDVMKPSWRGGDTDGHSEPGVGSEEEP